MSGCFTQLCQKSPQKFKSNEAWTLKSFYFMPSSFILWRWGPLSLKLLQCTFLMYRTYEPNLLSSSLTFLDNHFFYFWRLKRISAWYHFEFTTVLWDPSFVRFLDFSQNMYFKRYLFLLFRWLGRGNGWGWWRDGGRYWTCRRHI